MTKKKIKLNIGCGVHLISGFVNIDKYFTLEDLKSKKGLFENAKTPRNAEFVQADVLDLPFKSDSVDYIECVDMIEHLPFRQVIPAIKEMRRVLKKGGELRMMTTNFDDLVDLWNMQIRKKQLNMEEYVNLMEIIYGNQAGDGEVHKTAFNPPFFQHCLVEGGFKKVTMNIYPKGCPNKPALETQTWKKGWVMRSEMILAIMKK